MIIIIQLLKAPLFVHTHVPNHQNHLNFELSFFRDQHGVAYHHILVYILPSYELQHLIEEMI